MQNKKSAAMPNKKNNAHRVGDIHHAGMTHTGPHRTARLLEGKFGTDRAMEERRTALSRNIDVGAPIAKEHLRELNGLIGHHNKHHLGRTLPFARKDGTWYE